MVNTEDLLKEIKMVLRSIGVNKAITPKTNFQSLNIDSLSLMDIIISVEEKYHITLPDEKIVAVKTVNDLLQLLKLQIDGPNNE